MSRLQKILGFSLLLISVLTGYRAEAQYDDNNAVSRMYYYSGHFGSTEKVEFNLQITGATVSGSYIVERTGGLFTFSGRMASDRGAVGLIIFNEDNEFVATIEASLVSEDNNFAKELKGRWKSSDGKKQLTVSLKKVAELAGLTPDTKSQGQYGMLGKEQEQILAGFTPLDDPQQDDLKEMASSESPRGSQCLLHHLINDKQLKVLADHK